MPYQTRQIHRQTNCHPPAWVPRGFVRSRFLLIVPSSPRAIGMYVINVVGHKRDGGDLMCLDVSGEINVPGL